MPLASGYAYNARRMSQLQAGVEMGCTHTGWTLLMITPAIADLCALREISSFSPGTATDRIASSPTGNCRRSHRPAAAPRRRRTPQEDQPQAAACRFTRADTARTGPGTGLGLAIVAAITRRHGGTAHAGNHPHAGAKVFLRLPTGSAGTDQRPTRNPGAHTHAPVGQHDVQRRNRDNSQRAEARTPAQ